MSIIHNPGALLDNATRAAFSKNVLSMPAGARADTEITTKETPVYFWYLQDATANVKTTPTYTQSFSRMRDTSGTEAVVNVFDGRKLVPEEHFKDRTGKYRAIVKLFLLYERQQHLKDTEAAWPIATGWLVASDVIVTAGHCAFDHSHGLGRLIKVKAYVGYKGHGDLADTEGQWGTAVATTVGWCTGSGDEPSDISFIKLSSGFQTVNHFFGWTQTPISQDAAELGVVGYPGDIMNDGERGARMYEMFDSTTYNLANSDRHMLQYKIDTYGGNSGSPVLNNRQPPFISIGVHVLGGYSYNSASVFDGRYGNRFQALQKTAESLTTEKSLPSGAKHVDETNRPWLWVVKQTTTEALGDIAQQMLVASLTQADKVIAPIPSKMLYANPSELSFGPDIGPEISILAATAIATAGRLAADSRSGSHAESLGSTRPYDGITGRALLAEAALQFYTNELFDDDKKMATEFMAPVVAGLAPFVLKVAPRLLKGVLEPSFRILLSRVAGKTTPDRLRKDRSQEAELDTGFGRVLEGKELEFFNTLMQAAGEDTESIESFFSTLTTVGDFIGSAFKKAGPVLADVAKIGLPLLLGTEAGGVAPPPPSAPTYLDPLAHRAIVAEACLQACIAKRTELRLGKRFFKSLVTTVKTLGPKIVNVAPYAARLVGPIVGDVLRELEEKKKADEKRQEFLDFTWGH